jgi:hypothetical protein
MATVKLSTGREVDTSKIKRVNHRGSYVEIQLKTSDPDVTDDINVSLEDFERIEEPGATKAAGASKKGK